MSRSSNRSSITWWLARRCRPVGQDCHGRIGGSVSLEATGAPSLWGIDFVHVDNKDASLFPIAIPNHAGKMQMAMLHRPLYPALIPRKRPAKPRRARVDLDHESIWISYCPMASDILRTVSPRPV